MSIKYDLKEMAVNMFIFFFSVRIYLKITMLEVSFFAYTREYVHLDYKSFIILYSLL